MPTSISTIIGANMPPGPQGIQGVQGTQGLQGILGAGAGFNYTFSSTTTAADPGSGFFRFNSGTIGSITEMYISDIDAGGTDRSSALLTFDDTVGASRATIYLPGPGTGFTISITVTGAITNNGTWLTIPVTFDTGALPSNGDTRNLIGIRTGIQGVQGTLGSQGTQGLQGTIGAQGAQGTQGTQGRQGVQGTIGSQGTQGTQGTLGSQGSQGTQGTVGAGTQGTQGTISSQGAQGTFGAQGTVGAGTQGSQGTLGSQGSQGIQGTVGAGTQGSQGTLGSQGAQGTQGTVGAGTQGSQGTLGSQGAQGTQGTVGAGTQGSQGTLGSQGAQGTFGSQGIQGLLGSGSQGVQGVQGPAGAGGGGGSGNARITVTDTAPTSPTANTDFWWQSNTGSLKIYYSDGTSDQWVDVGGGGTSAGNGTGGSVGGANTHIQFNNNGTFDGDESYVINVASKLVGLDANIRLANASSLFLGGGQANTTANSKFKIAWNVTATSLDFTFVGD